MALAPAVSTAAQRALQTPAVFNVLPASFQPRQTYDVSPDIPRSYFLGHHRAALSSMRQVLANIGLIIECRDLRVPISSWNPLLEQSLSGARSDRDRIIVYTHRDLCPDSPSPFPYATSTSTASVVRHLRDFHARHNHAKQVLFLGAGAGADRDNHQARHHNHSHSHTRQVATLLEAIKSVARERDSLTGLRAMVVGMPNAGKSTLLNRLRARGGMARAKAARTGSQPGVTRRLSTPVRITGRESEDADADTDTDTSGLGEGVFLVDAPGVFVPYVSDPEAMLKLALVGCVHDGLVPRLTLADYLLFRLNLADPRAYVRRFGMAAPTNDVHELLRAAALRMGKLAKRGEADLEAAAESVVRDWRRGWLGRLVLDDVTPETLARAVEAAREPTVSMNQARKREKEARKAKREARRLGGLGDSDDGPL